MLLIITGINDELLMMMMMMMMKDELTLAWH